MSDFNRKDIKFSTARNYKWAMLGAFPKGEHPKCECCLFRPAVFRESWQTLVSNSGTYWCGTCASNAIKYQLTLKPDDNERFVAFSNFDLKLLSQEQLDILSGRVRAEQQRRIVSMTDEEETQLKEEMKEAIRNNEFQKAVDINRVLVQRSRSRLKGK